MDTNIKKILDITLKYEGYYANVAGDKGGETYAGIARKYNPTWTGWKIIDAIKKTRTIKYNEHIPSLYNSVYDYYYNKYWLGCASQIYTDDTDDYVCAALLYDFTVHSGKATASKYLQMAINTVNKTFLKVDGQIGANTVYTWKHTTDKHKVNCLYLKYRREYLMKVANNGSNHKFLSGWMNRCSNLQEKFDLFTLY